MKNWAWAKLKSYIIIGLTTVLLLEICSFFLFQHYYQEQIYNVANLRIFKRMTRDGVIRNAGAAWVMPVKENSEVDWHYNDFSVKIKTNGRGLRESFEVVDSAVDIAFLGDSFTFGHGVENDQRYSHVFSREAAFLNKKAVNFSYPNGWQPEHYEYFLRKSPTLKPEKVIVGLYLGNDLDSDLAETIYDREALTLETPYRVVSEEGYLRNRPDSYRFPIHPLIEYSYFVKLLALRLNNSSWRANLFAEKALETNRLNRISLEKGEEDLTNNRALVALREIKKIVEARGGQLTVLIIPQDFYFCDNKATAHLNPELLPSVAALRNGNNLLKMTRAALENSGIDYFDPSSVLKPEHYFSIDIHWSAAGHEVVGKALANHLKVDRTTIASQND